MTPLACFEASFGGHPRGASLWWFPFNPANGVPIIYLLEQIRHVTRKRDDPVGTNEEVLWVQDEGSPNPRLESIDEPRQGHVRVILRGLHLDGENLGFCLASIGQEEVDLDVVALLLLTVMGVEIKLMATCNEHLGDGVFVKHAFVDGQLSGEDGCVNFLRDQLVFVKGMGEEKPGIPHIAFHRRPGFVEGQPDIGVRAGEALIAMDRASSHRRRKAP